MKLDAKFVAPGGIIKVKDGSRLGDDEWMVFLAKDNALPATLRFYRDLCEKLGADAEQVAAVDRMMERVAEWRKLHPDRLKVPDARGEKLLDRPDV